MLLRLFTCAVNEFSCYNVNKSQSTTKLRTNAGFAVWMKCFGNNTCGGFALQHKTLTESSRAHLVFQPGKQKTMRGFETGQRSHHARPTPQCCDSSMEISSSPHSQRILIAWLAVFTFRGGHSVSPRNAWTACTGTKQPFHFPLMLLLFCSWIHFEQSLIFMLSVWRKAFTDPCVYGFFIQLGFLQDTASGTIKLISFKVDITQGWNALIHSLPAQLHDAHTWSKYRQMPREWNNTNPSLFAEGSRCRCNHAK